MKIQTTMVDTHSPLAAENLSSLPTLPENFFIDLFLQLSGDIANPVNNVPQELEQPQREVNEKKEEDVDLLFSTLFNPLGLQLLDLATSGELQVNQKNAVEVVEKQQHEPLAESFTVEQEPEAVKKMSIESIYLRGGVTGRAEFQEQNIKEMKNLPENVLAKPENPQPLPTSTVFKTVQPQIDTPIEPESRSLPVSPDPQLAAHFFDLMKPTKDEIIHPVNLPEQLIKSRQQASSFLPAREFLETSSPTIPDETKNATMVDVSKPIVEMQKVGELDSANDNKYSTVFANIGHLINDKVNSSLPLNAAPLDNQAVSVKSDRNHLFDPAHDIKMTWTTFPGALLTKETCDATIKIYPPHLGDVIAKLKINKNNTELEILAENNQVKAIIEANLPLLKQHFQAADIHLQTVQVNTFQTEQQTSQQQSRQSHEQSTYTPASVSKEQGELPTTKTEKSSENLVDTYA